MPSVQHDFAYTSAEEVCHIAASKKLEYEWALAWGACCIGAVCQPKKASRPSDNILKPCKS